MTSIVELRAYQMAAVREALLCGGLDRYYPGFETWLDRKVTPGIATKTRFCLGAFLNAALVGIAIGKIADDERKLSTIWVAKRYRGAGIGESLAQAAFARLGTSKPLFSVPEEKMPEFQRCLSRWEFRPGKVRPDAYRPGFREYLFNVD